MLEGFVSGLFIALLLGMFGVDKMVIEVVQPFVRLPLTPNHFYIALALVGLIGGIIGK